MRSLAGLIDLAIDLYVWLLIASAIMSWLVAFNVLNRHHRIVRMIGEFLWRVTEPALRPIRRVVPDLGGIDISPVILIFGLWFANSLLHEYVWPALV